MSRISSDDAYLMLTKWRGERAAIQLFQRAVLAARRKNNEVGVLPGGDVSQREPLRVRRTGQAADRMKMENVICVGTLYFTHGRG